MNRRDQMRWEEAARLEEQQRLEREMRNDPRFRARQRRWCTYGYLNDPWNGPGVVPLPDEDEELSEEANERVKDVRAKLYWIYRPKTVQEVKVKKQKNVP